MTQSNNENANNENANNESVDNESVNNEAANDPALLALLEFVKNSRGFDFSGYKPSTLIRRLRKRMGEVDINDFASYQDYLEVHPDEFDRLFNTLLINVTAFFRDPEAWELIRNEVVPAIVATKRTDESPIRVWSVGCASGQEAYTAAIILAEAIGIEAFCRQVKIYATDVDSEALTEGRHATYRADQLEPLTESQRDRFFEPTEADFVFRRDMRRKIIFGRHDLMQDAPISKIDLLLCRNTLMYFNNETQAEILTRLRFALRDNGFIFLGKAEMLLAHSEAFSTVSLRYRVFRKLPSPATSLKRLLPMLPESAAASPERFSGNAILQEMAFDSSPIARFVTNRAGNLMLVNAQAREMFDLSPAVVGQPLRDLEVSYRPVELRSCIDEVISQRHSVLLQSIRWNHPQSGIIFLDVQVRPLLDDDDTIQGISINFTDVTHSQQLQQELKNSKQELEVAYEELQSTNEELETTNEELQSSNEELETTNEELQSTNEELETMNEELQSTNEELQTVNDELHNSTEELNRSNAFLEAILASLDRGVVVVDCELIILAWNRQAEELWGVRKDEAIGRHLLNLDIGLPLDELRRPLRDCASGTATNEAEFTLNAVNRRGRRIDCQIICRPLVYSNPGSEETAIEGVILLMKDYIVPDESA